MSAQDFPRVSRRECLTLLACALTPPLAAGAATAAAPGAGPTASGSRLALLLGDQRYPAPFDLPPIPKNVNDLREALQGRGFDVTDAIDLDLRDARQAIQGFIARAAASPPDATLFFYFSGHGAQVDALNLLLPAGLDPSAPVDDVRRGSLQLLNDIVTALPPRTQGLTIAVVDACRTSLTTDDHTGLNQVEAPTGCLIAFSTGAGRPAIAPAVATRNTFYTASLVKLLRSVADETSFPDLLRLVKTDVHRTMAEFPIEIIRNLAQDPFIADNSVNTPPVGLLPPAGAAVTVRGDQEATAWAELGQATWPSEVARKADEFLRAFPASTLAAGATVALEGATQGATILHSADVRLQHAAFRLRADMDGAHASDLVRAGRGDKDAAARLGQRFANATDGPSAQGRYEGWLQYAAGLGNGIASYELALFYRRQGQPLLAARYEARARELGYTPPRSLDNSRK